MFISDTFTFKIECPSTIDAIEPISISKDQTVVMDHDPTFTPSFTFDSFLTKTTACRPK
jgi:hypothetical protein